VPYHESLDLSRVVILDSMPANAESWFCARAFELAAAAGIRGIVAFSDRPRRHGFERGGLVARSTSAVRSNRAYRASPARAMSC
jgi:hypothetical protein